MSSENIFSYLKHLFTFFISFNFNNLVHNIVTVLGIITGLYHRINSLSFIKAKTPWHYDVCIYQLYKHIYYRMNYRKDSDDGSGELFLWMWSFPNKIVNFVFIV